MTISAEDRITSEQPAIAVDHVLDEIERELGHPLTRDQRIGVMFALERFEGHVASRAACRWCGGSW
jgi:hypothetical protein